MRYILGPRRNHDGELNRRWHVKVNLNLELDDL